MIRFFEKDPYAPIQYTYEVSSILHKSKSRYQDIMVFEKVFSPRNFLLQ